MHPKWIHRFELRPGKWVFHPSDEAKKAGRKIKSEVETAWTAPDYFYHLRAGGHVQALKAHLGNASFLHLDIRDFFGSVSRSRVTRCLSAHFGYSRAREMANDSTVQHPTIKGKYMLPYGFVQSPILASLAFANSALGARIGQLAADPDFAVSVYVDDIVVSSRDDAALAARLPELAAAATRSHFELNEAKQEGPAPSVSAFNIDLTHAILALRQDRLEEFKDAYNRSDNEPQRAGILGYVLSVNATQATELRN